MPSFFPLEVRRITGLLALAVGLFRGAGFLLAGGDEVLDGEARFEVVEVAVDFDEGAWIGWGGTAAAGLIMS